MKYDRIAEGKFKERPNRFIAVVDIDGKEEKVHVKNTGRCKEILVSDAKVYLEDFKDRMGSRKMRYSLIGVVKKTDAGEISINMDSQAPNKVVKEALCDELIIPAGLENNDYIKSEYTFGESRIDFYVKDRAGREALMEVKGVTLENGGVAAFPDAPTERGVKHIEELIKARKQGYYAAIVFVIQMKNVNVFTPNYETHPEFGHALVRAQKEGVQILAYDCIVTNDGLSIDKPVEIRLEP